MSDAGRPSAVVTGGAGFIGSHVVDRLIAQGARVTVVDDLSVGRRENLQQALAGGRATLLVADVRDRGALERAFAGADVVYHLAVQCLRLSIADPHRVHEVNATGTLNALAAAHACSVARFVYVSSSEVYGSAVDDREPIGEAHPLAPTTPYGASKAAGELYADSYLRTFGLATTVVRPFNSYGPRSHGAGPSGEVIPRFVARVLGGERPVIYGDGQQTRDFTFVDDTARGIVAAADARAAGRTINVGRGREVTITAVAEAVARACGRPDLGPLYHAARPADVRRHLAATDEARRLLDFAAAVDLDEGVARYVEWVRAHGLDVSAAQAGQRNW